MDSGIKSSNITPSNPSDGNADAATLRKRLNDFRANVEVVEEGDEQNLSESGDFDDDDDDSIAVFEDDDPLESSCDISILSGIKAFLSDCPSQLKFKSWFTLCCHFILFGLCVILVILDGYNHIRVTYTILAPLYFVGFLIILRLFVFTVRILSVNIRRVIDRQSHYNSSLIFDSLDPGVWWFTTTAIFCIVCIVVKETIEDEEFFFERRNRSSSTAANRVEWWLKFFMWLFLVMSVRHLILQIAILYFQIAQSTHVLQKWARTMLGVHAFQKLTSRFYWSSLDKNEKEKARRIITESNFDPPFISLLSMSADCAEPSNWQIWRLRTVCKSHRMILFVNGQRFAIEKLRDASAVALPLFLELAEFERDRIIDRKEKKNKFISLKKMSPQIDHYAENLSIDKSNSDVNKTSTNQVLPPTKSNHPHYHDDDEESLSDNSKSILPINPALYAALDDLLADDTNRLLSKGQNKKNKTKTISRTLLNAGSVLKSTSPNARVRTMTAPRSGLGKYANGASVPWVTSAGVEGGGPMGSAASLVSNNLHNRIPFIPVNGVSSAGSGAQMEGNVQMGKSIGGATLRMVTNFGDSGKYFFLTRDTFLQFLTPTETDILLDFVDSGYSNKISDTRLTKGLLKLTSERRNLMKSLESHELIAENVATFLSVITWIIGLVIFLLLLGVDIVTLLVPVFTIVTALSFVFGNSAQTMFESIMFILIQYPYDIGDRCRIPSLYDSAVYVQKIRLMDTTFKSIHNRLIIVQNATLAKVLLINEARSPEATFQIDFKVSYATTPAKINALRQFVIDYCNANSAEWIDDVFFDVSEIQPDHYIQLGAYITHRANWSKWREIFPSRSRFVEALWVRLQELGIQYASAPLPVSQFVPSHTAFRSEHFNSLTANGFKSAHSLLNGASNGSRRNLFPDNVAVSSPFEHFGTSSISTPIPTNNGGVGLDILHQYQSSSTSPGLVENTNPLAASAATTTTPLSPQHNKNGTNSFQSQLLLLRDQLVQDAHSSVRPDFNYTASRPNHFTTNSSISAFTNNYSNYNTNNSHNNSNQIGVYSSPQPFQQAPNRNNHISHVFGTNSFTSPFTTTTFPVQQQNITVPHGTTSQRPPFHSYDNFPPPIVDEDEDSDYNNNDKKQLKSKQKGQQNTADIKKPSQYNGMNIYHDNNIVRPALSESGTVVIHKPNLTEYDESSEESNKAV